MRKVPLAPDVDARVVARGTPGFSGADLANLVNEAALVAARAGKRVVTQADFENAKDKVLMGAERRSMVMTEEEKELTAYHEAGHALVGLFVPGNDPLHKVTIIPRGRALGVTMNLPERDRYGSKNNVTTGAGNDIQQATNLARRMVTEWGMSDKLGPLRYEENQEEVFLGHSVARSQTISSETAKLIDQEIRRIIDEAETKATEVLNEHMDDLHTVAKGLLEYETLSGDDVQALLRGESIDRSGPDDAAAGGTSSGRRASVPSSGKPKGGEGDAGGLAPEPQPGS